MTNEYICHINIVLSIFADQLIDKKHTMDLVTKKTNLVVKANKLIEARYKFTLWEMRVFTSMVSLIKPKDIEFEYCKLYIKDLMKFYNSSSKEDYETIRRVPVSLSKKQVEIMYTGKEGKRRWANLTLFPAVTRPADNEPNGSNAYIELKFNEELKPLLLALKDKYRIYQIKNIIPLRSVYSIRLFELLKQYENTKQKARQFELYYLKEMLGLTETEDEFNDRIKRLRGKAREKAEKKGIIEKYPLYADFKKRVILKAQGDLEKFCDIAFTFEEIKEGRKVKAMKFHIIKNLVNVDTKNDLHFKDSKTETPKNEILAELFDLVKQWIDEDTLAGILKNTPVEQVRKAILLTLNRLKKGDVINNVAGHIITLSKKKDLKDSSEEKKKIIANVKSAEKKKGMVRKELQKEVKDLSKEWSKKEGELRDLLFSENPALRTNLFEQTKKNKFAHYKPNLTDEENLKDPIFFAAFSNAMKKMFPDRFEPLISNYTGKIKALERELELV